MSSSNAAVEGLAGAIGGCVALVTTYPLMTVSTLQATRHRAPSATSEGGTSTAYKKKAGTWADFAEVVGTSGWTALYRGLKPALLGTFASQGVYFYLYQLLRNGVVERRQRAALANPSGASNMPANEITAGTSLVLAFIAGCGNVLATNPIWCVATRMQAHQKSGQHDPPGALAVIKEIYDDNGILGFWKGCLPALLMVVNPSVQYMLYEWLTASLARWRRASATASDVFKRGAGAAAVAAPRASAAEVFMLSALAKLGATVVTYPLLMVKTRLMSAGRHTHAERQYRGTLDVILRVWRQEGFLGFYHGMRAKIVQSVLAAALLFAIKEELAGASQALLEAPKVIAK